MNACDVITRGMLLLLLLLGDDIWSIGCIPLVLVLSYRDVLSYHELIFY